MLVELDRTNGAIMVNNQTSAPERKLHAGIPCCPLSKNSGNRARISAMPTFTTRARGSFGEIKASVKYEKTHPVPRM